MSVFLPLMRPSNVITLRRWARKKTHFCKILNKTIAGNQNSSNRIHNRNDVNMYTSRTVNKIIIIKRTKAYKTQPLRRRNIHFVRAHPEVKPHIWMRNLNPKAHSSFDGKTDGGIYSYVHICGFDSRFVFASENMSEIKGISCEATAKCRQT